MWGDHGQERHKSVIRGGTVLRTGCWEDRTAWKLVSARNTEVVKAYAYLGGGTPHQPNHTYALVFRRMSLGLADRLYALALFLTQSTFVPECLVLHPEAYESQKDKKELQAARTDSVQSVLNSMRRNSSVFVPF